MSLQNILYLNHSQKTHDGSVEYLLDNIASNYTHRWFNRNLFVYKIDDLWMQFAFFHVSSCEMDGDKEVNRTGDLFWHGEGTLGNLKELRHSYFPEYVFYASPSFIKQCCDILLEYFEE